MPHSGRCRRRSTLDRSAATKQEIDTATADVRCKNEVGALTTLVAVTAEHQRALIRANAAELGRLKLLRQRYTAAAAQVLLDASRQGNPTPIRTGESER